MTFQQSLSNDNRSWQQANQNQSFGGGPDKATASNSGPGIKAKAHLKEKLLFATGV